MQLQNSIYFHKNYNLYLSIIYCNVSNYFIDIIMASASKKQRKEQVELAVKEKIDVINFLNEGLPEHFSTNLFENTNHVF